MRGTGPSSYFLFPSAVGGYIQWLIGAGQTLVMSAASIVWSPMPDDKVKLSQNIGKNQVVKIGASAQGFDGSEHIGRVSGAKRTYLQIRQTVV